MQEPSLHWNSAALHRVTEVNRDGDSEKLLQLRFFYSTPQKFNFFLISQFIWMNEWMMHLYSALLCIAVHPKRFTIMWREFLLNHHQCAASAWMWWQPQDNGASALTTHQLQVERRGVIEPIKLFQTITLSLAYCCTAARLNRLHSHQCRHTRSCVWYSVR